MKARKLVMSVVVAATLTTTMLLLALAPTSALPRVGHYTLRATGSYEEGSNPMMQEVFVRYSNWTAYNFKIENAYMSYPMGPSPTITLKFGYLKTNAIALQLDTDGYHVLRGSFDGTALGVSSRIVGDPFGVLEPFSADMGRIHIDFQRPGQDGVFAHITARALGNVKVVNPVASAGIGEGDAIYFGSEYVLDLTLVQPRYDVRWNSTEGQTLTITMSNQETRRVWVDVLWTAAEVDWKNGVHLLCEFKGGTVSGGGSIPVSVQPNEGFSEVYDWH
ncbi:MAG: hypothetical protein QW587_05365, partial [Candidatus Bathyarchaeia archaeon]